MDCSSKKPNQVCIKLSHKSQNGKISNSILEQITLIKPQHIRQEITLNEEIKVIQINMMKKIMRKIMMENLMEILEK